MNNNPTIPCEICEQQVPYNDYKEHIGIRQQRSSILNLLNPMMNSFLSTENMNILDFVDTTQMNNIILEMTGNVNNGVHEIGEAIQIVKKEDIEVDLECSICVENLSSVVNTVIKTKCGHYFCRDCIIRWFKDNNKCPLCLYNFNN